MNRVLESVVRSIGAHQMVAPADTIVVAVSGGPDSLCLLHVLCALREELDISLHVAHLDHGLRGRESAADAAFVGELARAWQLPVTVEAADVAAYRRAHKLSLEEAARQVRYAFLADVARRVSANAVAVGHTADDQVETILMHWLRGAGLTGLRGMLPVQRLPGTAEHESIRLIRPLLEITRGETEDYCRAHGLAPRRDRSNEDDRLRRNRVRRQVLPLLEQFNPNLRSLLLRTARIVADDEACMDQQTATAWRAVAQVEEGSVSFHLDQWQGIPAALQRRLLRRAWAHLSGALSDLSWVHVEQARDIIARRRVGTGAHLPGGVSLLVGYTAFTVGRQGSGPVAHPDLPLLTTESLPIACPGVTLLPGGRWRVEAEVLPVERAGQMLGRPSHLEEIFDAGAIGRELLLRRRRPGDRMQPLGMAGTKKLQDIMVDARIPRAWRGAVPVLATPDRIVWVVGTRPAEWSKVTPGTTSITRVRFVQERGTDDASR